MILTAHQTGYIPWSGFFHKVSLCDVYVHFDQVQFQPKDFNSRNYILSGGRKSLLTVPTLNKGYLETKFADVEINNQVNWGAKHFKTLVHAYKKQKYFSRYEAFFEDIYQKDWLKIIDLNKVLFNFFLMELGINVKIIEAKDLNLKGVKSDLVLDMCKKLSANKYIFGANGKDYADTQSFISNGIDLHFQNYVHPVYDQGHNEFISHLSILDVLFRYGDHTLDIICSSNEKKEALSC